MGNKNSVENSPDPNVGNSPDPQKKIAEIDSALSYFLDLVKLFLDNAPLERIVAVMMFIWVAKKIFANRCGKCCSY